MTATANPTIEDLINAAMAANVEAQFPNLIRAIAALDRQVRTVNQRLDERAQPEAVAKMPPEIAKAMIKVMGEIDTVERDEQHERGEESFSSASVDAIFDKTRGLCAKNGIMVMPLLIATRKIGHLDQYEYQFVVYHETGVEFSDPRWRQVIDVVPEGPWTSGKVQSLAVKYCLKNVFQIATGEGDGVSPAQNGQQPTPKAAEKPTGPSELAKTMAGHIEGRETLQQLDEWLEANMAAIDELCKNKVDKAAIDLALKKRRKELGAGKKPVAVNDAAKANEAA